jgi:hypothetical protein
VESFCGISLEQEAHRIHCRNSRTPSTAAILTSQCSRRLSSPQILKKPGFHNNKFRWAPPVHSPAKTAQSALSYVPLCHKPRETGETVKFSSLKKSVFSTTPYGYAPFAFHYRISLNDTLRIHPVRNSCLHEIHANSGELHFDPNSSASAGRDLPARMPD